MNATDTRPTSDERVWAALVHGSAILFFFGFLISAIVWATQRKKSGFVAFHALQALGYQMISFMLWILLSFLVPLIVIPFVVFGAAFESSVQSGKLPGEIFPIWFTFIFWGLFLGMFGIYIIVAFIGAGLTLSGKDFRYPLLGKWLARYVRYQPAAQSDPKGFELDEERGDRWVAAMSHTSVILNLWGILLPLIVWITEKERSKVLRFQALQAVIYQALGIVAYFGAMACYMVGFFGLFVSMIGVSSRNHGSPPVGVIIFFLVFLLVVVVYMLLMPLYQIIGQVAAIRVLQGKDYRYPLVGRWTEKWIGQPKPVVSDSSGDAE